MKRARRQNFIIHGSIACSVLFVALYGISRYAHARITQAPIAIVHSGLFSDAYAAQVTQDLTDALHAQGPAAVVAQPASYSPMLSSLTVRYRYPYHGIMSYGTVEPCATLNHMVIALSTGDLVPQDMVDDAYRAALPSVQVPSAVLSEQKAPEILTEFLKSIEPSLAQRFSCEWQDADRCVYRDTVHPRHALVAYGHTPLTHDAVQVYDAVVEQHKPERVAKRWSVDIRFNGQVIVSPDGGV